MARLSRNPLSPVSYSVAKGVRKNNAVIRYVVQLDDKLSLQKRNVVFERKVWLYSVTKASEYLVSDNENIASSIDLVFTDKEGHIVLADIKTTYGGLDRNYKIEAMEFWNNDPAKFRLTLKGG